MLNRVTFVMNLATVLVVSLTGVYVLIALTDVLPAQVRWGLMVLCFGWALARVATLMRGCGRQRETLIQ
jgi:hypothetical protein